MNMRRYRSCVAALLLATAPIIAPHDAQAGAPQAVADVGASAPVAPLAPLATPASPADGDSASAYVPYAGGPPETLAQCMAYWDADTHMTKAEWARACQRTGDGTQF
jgi:hypothetical protein